MAFTAAASGRPGPAVLLCPYDLIGAIRGAPAPAAAPTLGRYPLDRVLADPAQIEAAADLLAAAERPLIVAGGGVHLSDAAAELAALQEKASLPVATTTMGKGAVDERHPLSIGVIGYFMGPGGMARYQRPLIDEADVDPAGGQPDQPERHRLLDPAAARRPLHPSRHRRRRGRPQLRGAAARRRCEADAGSPDPRAAGRAISRKRRAWRAVVQSAHRRRARPPSRRRLRRCTGSSRQADPARAPDGRSRRSC